MGEPFASLSKKKAAHVAVAGIIDTHQTMLAAIFEGYIVSRYG
jgi:hypothetical protein